MKSVIASGTRKKAIARASIKDGKGKVKINNINLDQFEPALLREKIKEPILIGKAVADKVDIRINLNGGGIMGQAEAARLAVARGLVAYSKSASLKNEYQKYDRHLLVADVRQNETAKPNSHSKPRAKRQKSYR